jgi:hypothetical protein
MAIPADRKQKTARHEAVDWLPRTRVRGKGGDFLVVVLSSAVFIMLGLAAMIVRFGPADPASALTAPRQNLGAYLQPAQSKPTPAALEQTEIVRSQNEIVRNIASVGSNPSGSTAPAVSLSASNLSASGLPSSAAPVLPADALAPGRVAREPAIVAAAPIAAQPPGVAFAPDPPPLAPRVITYPERVPEPPVRAFLRKPEIEVRPENSPEPARPQIAKAEAPPPAAALRKGGEGATWAAYFDSFPDQRAAAAQINALQSKYSPHLGGRRLTYTRKGETWLMRASGLTQEAADQVCEKVRKAGSACSVGGR